MIALGNLLLGEARRRRKAARRAMTVHAVLLAATAATLAWCAYNLFVK